MPGTGIEPVRLAPRDFKSLVSTYFTIRAFIAGRKLLAFEFLGNPFIHHFEKLRLAAGHVG